MRAIFHGQWPHQDSIDDAEYRGGSADAQSQREYGDNCEARTLREDTLSVVKILHHFISKADTARLPAFLFDALDGAELKASAAQRFLAR